jgi:hypothetical protein
VLFKLFVYLCDLLRAPFLCVSGGGGRIQLELAVSSRADRAGRAGKQAV